MLTITSLSGENEPLTGFKSLKRTRKVNGEKQLTLTVLPVESNKYAFPLVEEEAIIEFDDEEYVIKQLNESSVGNTYYKEVTAVHKFFNDMLNDRIYDTYTGSMTFANAVNFVFNGSGYTPNIINLFDAQELENFGNNNRLALLQDLLESYEAEFKVVGNSVYFYEKIGNDTDFQFRYNFNVKTIQRNIDTTNLSTYIKGTGKRDDNGNPLITAEYTSPNAQVFGILHAEPVDDERYTTQDGLLARLKNDLQDEPDVSLTIDFIDLRAAGYPFTVPNEGDRVFVIYEPMDDLNVEVRIMEIDESFDDNLEPIQTTITLANYTDDFAGTLFQTVDKTVNDAMSTIVGSDGKIKFDVLDEAVQQATNDLKSAETELKFDNGIIAIDKDDPNKLVLLNSAGIGISSDGGNTFKTAMTGDGIVADVITAGTLRGIYIEGVEISGSTIISAEDETTYTKIEDSYLESRGKYTRTWRNKTTTADVKLKLENGYLRARNDDKQWSLYFSDFGISTYNDAVGDNNASGYIEFHSDNYSDDGNQSGITIGSLAGRVALETDGARIYLNPNGASVQVADKNNNYYPIAASSFTQSSERTLKRDIQDLQDSGLDVVKSMRIREYKRLTKGEATPMDKWQAGLVLDEAPIQLIDGIGIDLYTMTSYIAKAVQELSDKVDKLEGSP